MTASANHLIATTHPVDPEKLTADEGFAIIQKMSGFERRLQVGAIVVSEVAGFDSLIYARVTYNDGDIACLELVEKTGVIDVDNWFHRLLMEAFEKRGFARMRASEHQHIRWKLHSHFISPWTGKYQSSPVQYRGA